MISLTLLIIVGLLTYWGYWRRSKLTLFQRNGIPCPTPHPIFGNMLDYRRMGTIRFQEELLQKYGPIVGYYLGTVPYLIVAEKGLLHLILIKDASIFITRPRRIPGGVNPDPKRGRMLAHLPPAEWQVVRKALSGMFSPSKLKANMVEVGRTVDELLRVLGNNLSSSSSSDNKNNNGADNGSNSEEEEADGGFNIGECFETLSLDAIGRIAFGRVANVQTNLKDELLLAVRDKYKKGMLSPLNMLSLCLPEAYPLIYPLRVGWLRVKEWSGYGGERNTTLWQVAAKCLQDALTDAGQEQPPKDNQFHILQRAKIKSELCVAYCVNAFQGDYENVTTTLSFMAQLLAENPHVQDKIREEYAAALGGFGGVVPSGGEEMYELYSALPYMESVIYETLRLWPQTSFVRRSPSKDYPYVVAASGDEMVIPAGVHIQAAHYAVQRDKEEWGEAAAAFNPERFYPKNGEIDGRIVESGGESDRGKVSPNCVTYQGFGSGPRHCMGQKFATLLLKMVITRIVQHYRFEECGRSVRAVHHGDALMRPDTPFYLRLEKL